MYAKKLANQFQSTHPHGVRHPIEMSLSSTSVFQSTHPHGVRHSVVYRVLNTHTFQSTHPHGVRLRRRRRGGRGSPVSIHAPTWGATMYFLNYSDCHSVSIHAPTWGATLPSSLVVELSSFQSTHPHGVRRKNGKLTCRLKCVSIHAPTWGATCL